MHYSLQSGHNKLLLWVQRNSISFEHSIEGVIVLLFAEIFNDRNPFHETDWSHKRAKPILEYFTETFNDTMNPYNSLLKNANF